MESDSDLPCYTWKKEMPQNSENFLPASPVSAPCGWGGWSLPMKKLVQTPPSSSGVGGLGLLSGSKLALMVFFYFSLLLLLRRKTWSLSFTAFFHLPFFLLQYIFYQQTITAMTRRSDVLSRCLQFCSVRLWICSSLFPPHATTPHPQTKQWVLELPLSFRGRNKLPLIPSTEFNFRKEYKPSAFPSLHLLSISACVSRVLLQETLLHLIQLLGSSES